MRITILRSMAIGPGWQGPREGAGLSSATFKAAAAAGEWHSPIKAQRPDGRLSEPQAAQAPLNRTLRFVGFVAYHIGPLSFWASNLYAELRPDRCQDLRTDPGPARSQEAPAQRDQFAQRHLRRSDRLAEPQVQP